MTTLHNEIVVDAPPAAVWSVLSTLDVLHEYDPGVRLAKRVGEVPAGLGAARRCELAPSGWFEERVVEWDPDSRIAFELFDCTLPVRRLRHTYELTAEGGSTRVTQRMEYELKYGLLGALLDRAVVRRQWDAGIKGFFTGLKRRVESAR
jgi:ligand-binding SRPBCC domain-containing protein